MSRALITPAGLRAAERGALETATALTAADDRRGDAMTLPARLLARLLVVSGEETERRVSTFVKMAVLICIVP